jgi:hypothetical protein
MSKIASYPVLIFTQDKTFKVEGEFDSSNIPANKNFIDGKGYLDIKDEHAWIYSDGEPRDPNQYPYFWIENGKYKKSEPTNEIYRQFRLNKFVNYNTDHIIQVTNKSDNTDPIYVDDVINDLNASSEIFHPVMYTKDDFLKKTIKTVINVLNISLSKYKYKMTQKYMISNMKSALLSPTKMSTMYFNAWAEMLGLKVTMIIESTDASEDKLDEPYVYLSERDSVFKLSELGPDFKFPEIPETEAEE